MDILDKKLDKLLDEIAPLAAEQISESIPDPAENYVFSKEHEEKMQKFFRQEHNKSSYKNMSRHLSRAAVVMLFLTVAMYGVINWQGNDVECPYYAYCNDGGQQLTGEAIIPGSSLRLGELYFRHIPYGFSLKYSNVSDGRLFAQFAWYDLYFKVHAYDNGAGLDISIDGNIYEGEIAKILYNIQPCNYT